MPRTVSKSKNSIEERSNERAIRVEKSNFWESLMRFITARETRMVIGILLLLFSVIALLSYVSFLFTGTYDQDILSLDRAGRLANREAIRNMLGLPGAMLAQFMIDGSFGFVSILLVFMLAIYALRLMHVRQVPVDSGCLGESALAAEPAIRQVFVTGTGDDVPEHFPRTLYNIRRRIEQRIREMAAAEGSGGDRVRRAYSGRTMCQGGLSEWVPGGLLC